MHHANMHHANMHQGNMHRANMHLLWVPCISSTEELLGSCMVTASISKPAMGEVVQMLWLPLLPVHAETTSQKRCMQQTADPTRTVDIMCQVYLTVMLALLFKFCDEQR